MPRPTNRSKTHAPKYKWIGHIAVHFNDTERANVMDYLEERSISLEDAIVALTQQDISIKFTYDTSQDQYYCTLQPKSNSNPYCGYTIGFSHVILNRLAGIAVYVSTELMEAQGLEKPGSEARQDW